MRKNKWKGYNIEINFCIGGELVVRNYITFQVKVHLIKSSIMILCVSLQLAEGIKPTLNELEKFEDKPEGIDVHCILV